nr:MAG TPA: YvrJ protein family protein [Caudoviricetes sp.]
MNVNDIVTLIGSLGFPIVACVGMFYLYNRTLKDFTATLGDIVTQIKELREDIKELVNGGKNA